MAQEARELICMSTRGTDHELSSVGFTIANGGITAGLKVFIFLSSSGVDLVRKRAADTTQVNPLEPLAKLVNDFMARGGTIWACTISWLIAAFVRSRYRGRDVRFTGRLCFAFKLI
jgi:predicted peroxiredoxin